MGSASRAQAGGSVAQVLMILPNPEANALSQPHSIKPAHLETRFSSDCSGNKLFKAYESRRVLLLAE